MILIDGVEYDHYEAVKQLLMIEADIYTHERMVKSSAITLAVIKYQHAVCYEAVYADIDSGSPDVEQTWQDFGRLSEELDQAEIDVEELTNELAELYILHDSWIRIADTLLQLEEQRGNT